MKLYNEWNKMKQQIIVKCVLLKVQTLIISNKLQDVSQRSWQYPDISFTTCSSEYAIQPCLSTAGKLGMMVWCQTEDFKSLNVGFAMDEGLANPGEEMRVFYSERCVRCESIWCTLK